MQTIGYAALQVIPSMRGATKSIEGQLGALGAAGDKAGSRIGSSLKKGMKWGVLGAVGIGTAVAAIAAKGGINRALAIEGAEKKLEGLGHSAESISTIMGNALASVKGTAYGLGDAASVAAGLVASGVKAGGELEGVLKTVTDTAAISGRTMTDIGTIFGSVAARGKLQGDDMLQLMSSGVPVLQLVAKQLNITSAEASALVSKGKVDFATFAAAMQQGMGGAALKGAETFQGALSNVYAALGRFGATGAAPSLSILKGLFNDAVPVIDALTAKVAPLAETLAAKVAPAVAAVSDKVGGFITSLLDGKGLESSPLLSFGKELVSGLGDTVGTVVSLVKPIGDAFMTGLGPTISTLGPQIAGIASAFSPLGAVMKVLQPIMPQVANALAMVAGALGGALSAVLPTVVSLVDALAQVMSGWLAAALPVMASSVSTLVGVVGQLVPPLAQVAQVIIGALSGALGAVLPVLADLAGTLVSALAPILPPIASLVAQLATTLGGVLGSALAVAVPLLSELGGAVLQTIAAVLPGLMPLVEGLGTVLSAVMTAVQPLVPLLLSLVQQVLSALLPVLPTLGGLLGTVAGALGQVLSAVAPLIGVLGKLIATGLKVLLSVVPPIVKVVAGLANVIAKVLTAAVKVITPVITAVIGVLTGFADFLVGVVSGSVRGVSKVISAVWNAIKVHSAAVWNAIRLAITVPLNMALVVVKGIVSGVRNAISTVWETVKSLTSGAWTAVKEAVDGGVGGVIELVKSLPGRALDALSTIGSTLLSAGRDLIGGFIQGIRNAAGSLISAIKSTITDKLPGFVKKALGIASPSKVFAAIGRWIPAGLAKGITAGSSVLDKTLAGLTSRITKTTENAIRKETDRLVAERKKQNAAIIAANKAAAKKRDAALAAADKITDAKKRAAAKKAAQAQYKASLRETLGALSRSDAEKIAKKNLASLIAAQKAANALINAQGRTTKSTWRKGAGAGTDAIVDALRSDGRLKKSSKIEKVTLADLAKARDVLTGRLEKAKSKLADAIALRDDFKASVVDSVKSFTSLMGAQAKQLTNGYEAALTSSDITAHMRDRLAQTRKFTTNMAVLLKRGLNKSTYEELIRQGPEAAGAYAQALVNGGRSAVGEVNSLTAQIDKAATGLGSTSSQVLYQAGVDAARGVVEGIKSQIEKIDAAADQVAKSLVKAVKKALGIASPSRVLAQIGRFATAGFGIGVGDRRAGASVIGAAKSLANRTAVAFNDAAVLTPTLATPSLRTPTLGDAPASKRVKGERTLTEADIEALTESLLTAVGALPAPILEIDRRRFARAVTEAQENAPTYGIRTKKGGAR